MSNDDEDILALARARAVTDEAHVVPGSVQISAGCGHQAWISPSGMLLLVSRKLRTVCDECVPDGPLNAAETPGSRAELQAAMPAAAADMDYMLDHLRTRGMPRRRTR